MSWMLDRRICRLSIGLLAAASGLPGLMSTATAQARDPVYDAARRQGLVGERVDGYLGIVVPPPPSPELQRLVRDINIKRKALYVEKARAERVTAETFAFVAACIAIARSAPGEKYQAPDGTWRTRGSEPPERDSRCP